MKFEDLEMKETVMPNGKQAVLEFGSYELSIVKNDVSYGNKQGLYEIAVFHNGEQKEMPGITQEGDTVKGFLTEEDVSAIIKKMHLVSGADPVQI